MTKKESLFNKIKKHVTLLIEHKSKVDKIKNEHPDIEGVINYMSDVIISTVNINTRFTLSELYTFRGLSDIYFNNDSLLLSFCTFDDEHEIENVLSLCGFSIDENFKTSFPADNSVTIEIPFERFL